MCQHMREQCVRRDVEGNPKTHITGPLVELAVEVTLWLLFLLCRTMTLTIPLPWIRHVELCKHMTWRQSHLLQIRRIPRAQDDPPIVRIIPQLLHHLRQLIDALPRVIRPRIHILGAEVAPLEAIHGAQIADLAVRQPHRVEVLAGAVAVPDLDAGGSEGQRRGGARDEPEQLGDDGAQEDALRGEEREERRPGRCAEGEFEGPRGEEGVGACAGSWGKC